MDNNCKKILITGSTGLVGKHLIERLFSQHEIYAVTHNTSELKCSKINYCYIDFTTNWLIEDLPKSIDIIIHLAQSSHINDFPSQALNIFKINTESTAKLLNYALLSGTKKFIYASSGGVYGSGNFPFSEESLIQEPKDLAYYISSKICSEILIKTYRSLIDITILRPFFIYGLGQKRNMLLPRLVDRIRNGTPITLQGIEGIKINPIHVSNCVDLIEACLDNSNNQIINVSGSEIFSIKAISEMIGDYLKINPIFEYLPGDPQNIIGNNDLMIQIINKQTLPLFFGLKDIL